MKLFAIGDLHLSHSSNKPMSIFGPNWDNHAERIAAAWRERVSDEDAVLIPGDISWAMQLDEAFLRLYVRAVHMEQVGILYLMSARHVFKQLLCTESRHKPIR